MKYATIDLELLSIVEVLREFREAETIDDYLEHLDNLDIIEEEAREFFTDGPGSREKIKKYHQLSPIHTKDGRTYIRLQALLESGNIRVLCLQLSPEGPKIDFHAYAQTNSHSWEDLLSGKIAEGTEMRLGIRPDAFYLGEFQDDSIWQCFRGIAPNLEEHLSLYIRRENVSKFLQKLIDGRRSSSVTLKLKSIGDSHQRKQFEIVEIYQFHWLTITDPDKK